MSKECAICGKKAMVGNNVSHAHNLNKRRFNPNLQRVRAVVKPGCVKKIDVCTSCIKAGKVVKAAQLKLIFTLNLNSLVLNKKILSLI